MHSISSKLATVAVALMMDGLMIGGMAYVFSLELHRACSAVVAWGSAYAVYALA